MKYERTTDVYGNEGIAMLPESAEDESGWRSDPDRDESPRPVDSDQEKSQKATRPSSAS